MLKEAGESEGNTIETSKIGSFGVCFFNLKKNVMLKDWVLILSKLAFTWSKALSNTASVSSVINGEQF